MTDEQVLITQAQRGDPEAFRELVERSKINVYRLAYDLTGNHHDAEDLSQEVFVKAYRGLPNFRGNAKWSTWLYRITTNACIDHRRSQSRTTMEYKDDLGDDETTSEHNHRHSVLNPDRSVEAGMIQENIERALSRLAPQERSVFVLRHYHDLPLKEIAETMKIAEGTVKSYLFRALQRLQRELAFYKKDLGLEEQ
ncbi:MAG: RNA polymerase sigma factor [Ignavibacteria bacterium]|nr:RNA polymerase sigma factor [Ignavibacteria bacterium]MBI3765529.1 RNA polymerase sigma factor [Ignavibacteriales bacterium]